MDAREWGRWWRLIGRAGLNNLLSGEWDPIGDVPADEYNAVTGPVAALLRSGAPTDQIANTLSEYRTRQRGLEPDPYADRRVAETIVRWYHLAMTRARPSKPANARRPTATSLSGCGSRRSPMDPAAQRGFVMPLLRQPGTLLAMVAVGLVGLMVEASSRMSFDAVMFAYLVLMAGAVWFALTLRDLLRRRVWHPPVRSLFVPAVLVAGFALTVSGAAADIRFALSRPGMDDYVLEVQATGRVERDWVGLYPVAHAERTADGVQFVIAGSGLITRVGYRYSPSTPVAFGEDQYLHAVDNWWLWYDGFE